jgi:microcystin-dependent protein
MSNPFIGEIRMFGANFAPQNWAFTNGQLVPIAQDEALFNLLGTTFGGDGQTTFALPDLQSRSPMHAGTGLGLSPRVLGDKGGAETATLAPVPIPSAPVAPVPALTFGSLQFPSQSPFCVVTFIISMFGIFPSQT